VTTRRGIALLTVLWVLSVAGAIALTADSGGRDGLDAARHRVARTRAAWEAQGCAALALSQADALYRGADEGPDRTRVWLDLSQGELLSARAEYPDCEPTLESAGARFAINFATGDEIRAFLGAAVPPREVSGVADAVEDWLDEDDIVRGTGAEYAWYSARDRSPPRNGAFRAPEELLSVRGLEERVALAYLVSTDPAPIDILHARPEVLLTVPGFTNGLVSAIISRRAEGWRPTSLRDLSSIVDAGAAATFESRFVEAARATALEPSAWILTATVRSEHGLAERSEEWRVARRRSGLVVEGRRLW